MPQTLYNHSNHITKLFQDSIVHDKDIKVLSNKVTNELKDIPAKSIKSKQLYYPKQGLLSKKSL
eukprot:5677216-Ditylum_brightwellii.AAC.1